MDGGVIASWCAAGANAAVAIATFCLAYKTAKQMRLLKVQADAAREERELAKRPNLFVAPYGLSLATSPPVEKPPGMDAPLALFLLNMSLHPVLPASAFIYAWRPGQPFPERPGEEEKGRITALNVVSATRDKELPVLPTGKHAWLVPVEEENFWLFPENVGDEKSFLLTLSVLYPAAPGGVAILYYPVRLRAIGERKLVGWADLENGKVSFPVRLPETSEDPDVKWRNKKH